MNNEISLKYLYTALADEILATYQYWTALNSSRGAGKSDADPEFEAHYKEEWDHANQVMERIKQLGGEPFPDPKELEGAANPWKPISSRKVEEQLNTTMEAEVAAINFYTEAVEAVREEDSTTHKLFRSILKDEEEHLYDLKELYCEIVPGTEFKEIDSLFASDKDLMDVVEDEEMDMEEDKEEGAHIHASEENVMEEEDKGFSNWASEIELFMEEAEIADQNASDVIGDISEKYESILDKVHEREISFPEEAEENAEWFEDVTSRIEYILGALEEARNSIEDSDYDVESEEEEEEI